MTNAELHALLSHPDAYVRSLADHANRARRVVRGEGIAPYRLEDALIDRLARLDAAGLTASDHYYV